VDELKSEYKVHSSRIVQGKLGNSWFLSAASMVASELKLFEQVAVCDGDFAFFRQYGIYCFRFFKNGLPYYVVIDDRIPAIEK